MSVFDRIGALFWKVLVAIDAFVFCVLGWFWRPLSRLWDIVRPSRFSVFTLLAGGVLLVFTPQGRELALRFRDEDVSTFWMMVKFLVAVGWFAFQAWYWARIAFYLEGGQGHRAASPGRKWAPRIYAAAAFLFAALSLWLAEMGDLALITLVAGLVFVTILVIRIPLAERLGMAVDPKEIGGSQQPLVFADLAPISKWTLYGSLLLSLVMLIAIICWPVGIGQFFGAAAIAFLAFGQIVPVGSALVFRSRETGIPIISCLIVYAALISPLADNHRVPVVDPGTEFTDPRPNVDQAVAAWLDANGGAAPTRPPGGGDTARPVIFISTAGGGLRAAYWTAVVLGALQEECPGVERHVFSISGVSGGSVGAAVYATALKADLAAKAGELCSTLGGGGIRAQMLDTLSAEFLGPTVAAMLYPDLVQRFVPAPVLPDRGAALTGAWNASWIETCERTEGCDPESGNLDDGFLKIADVPAKGRPWHPILLLNGTHQETGKRLIASNVQVTADVFLDAFDLHEVVAHDVSMGTAALNSARFTYVSPAGRLVRATDGAGMGHVLDGGYFENYGAVTGAEIARAAVKAFEKRGVAIRPILIQISSDPELSERDLPVQAKGFLPLRPEPAGRWPELLDVIRCKFAGEGGEGCSADRPGLLANEALGPLFALLNTRTARGVLANKTIADVVDSLKAEGHRFPAAIDPVFAHFSICAAEGGREPPLGWAMSQRAGDDLEAMIGGRCGENDNAAAMAAVLEALTAPLPVGCTSDTPSGTFYCSTP
jgi:hypothetical protein